MRYLRSLALTAALAVAGCTGGPAVDEEPTDQPVEPTTEPAEAAGDAEVVDIVDFAFSPDDLEVPVGSTVEWVQQDDSRHTVDFEDGEESGDLEQGDTYRRTFDEAGTYDYICFFHPRMTASVTVTR